MQTENKENINDTPQMSSMKEPIEEKILIQ